MSQFVVENKIQGVEMFSISPNESYGDSVGNTEFLDEQYGLTPEKISLFVKNIIK